MRRTTSLLVLLTLPLACNAEGPLEVPPITTEPPPPAIPAGVHVLDGISESLPHADLEPFRQIVGSARFVALGESVHMSRGYYQAKSRMIRFMVEQMGFRVVVFETQWIEGRVAAEYVATCGGTPERALQALYGVWRDTVVRDLLRWMCEYNRRNPADPVIFAGFDIQEPAPAAAAARAFVQRAAPAEMPRTDPLLHCLGASHRDLFSFFGSPDYRNHVEGRRDAAANDRCMAGLADVAAWIDANVAALTTATSASTVEEARLALLSLRAWQEQLWIPDPGGYEARDRGMAEMIRRLDALHHGGRRTVIWAWNWHIARNYQEVRGWNDDPQASLGRQGARAMGYWLNQWFGEAYLPIALIGHRVELTGGNNPPVTSHPEAVEWRLSQLGKDHLLVDLRQPVGDTLLPAQRRYQVSQEWGDPYRQFGALVWLRHSPAMTFVGGGGG